jgi:alcohol dehydrogenase
VCNAVLLPHVERYNATVAAPRLKDVAVALGVDVAGLNDQQAAEAAIQAISQMASDVGIPAGLKDLGVKEEDFNILADNALKDACGLTNPKKATHAEIVEIFAAAF